MIGAARTTRAWEVSSRLPNSPPLTRPPTRSFTLTKTTNPSVILRSTLSTSAITRSTAPSERPSLFRLTNATVLPFGSSDREPQPTFSNLSLDIADDGSCWAILSTSLSGTNTANLLLALQDHATFRPPGAGAFPFLAALPPRPRPDAQGGPREATVADAVKLVSFKTRLAGSGGEFQDYSARYGAIRDEDRLTLRAHLSTQRPWTGEAEEVIWEDVEATAKALDMDGFLDLPMVTLSNGQTRRARIVGALLEKPELLILEEPFSKPHPGSSPYVLLVLT